MSDDFTASVQYDDFKGTVAADMSDTESMQSYLESEGLAEPSERVVGYRVCFGANHGKEVERPGIVIYLSAKGFDEPMQSIRAIEIEMTTAKLFSFFKRFDCVFTQKGQQFDGATIEGPHIP
jgi:hypothetical protein